MQTDQTTDNYKDFEITVMGKLHKKSSDDLFPTTEKFYEAQRLLSRGQRYFIIGLLFSCLKMVLGCVQLGYALGCMLLGAPLSIACSCSTQAWRAWYLNGLFALGNFGFSFGYAVANLVTLGLLGCCVEDCVGSK